VSGSGIVVDRLGRITNSHVRSDGQSSSSELRPVARRLRRQAGPEPRESDRRRKRTVVSVVCLVVIIATAMAPISAAAFCVELAPAPALFADVLLAPVPAEPAPRIDVALDASPLALRAPPSA